MPYGSPNEMGHSPMENQNKGYAKQEKKDLMQDMPIVKDAIGARSWMSKHSKSAFQMGHSPAEMSHDSPAKQKITSSTAKNIVDAASNVNPMREAAKLASEAHELSFKDNPNDFSEGLAKEKRKNAKAIYNALTPKGKKITNEYLSGKRKITR